MAERRLTLEERVERLEDKVQQLADLFEEWLVKEPAETPPRLHIDCTSRVA